MRIAINNSRLQFCTTPQTIRSALNVFFTQTLILGTGSKQVLQSPKTPSTGQCTCIGVLGFKWIHSIGSKYPSCIPRQGITVPLESI